jgi:hypothetical protein
LPLFEPAPLAAGASESDWHLKDASAPEPPMTPISPMLQVRPVADHDGDEHNKTE